MDANILVNMPAAKVGVLYQRDEFGQTYLDGLKEGFGKEYARHVVQEAAFDESGKDLDPAIEKLKASGADAVVLAIAPFFPPPARSTRSIALGWRPDRFIASPSSRRVCSSRWGSTR